MLKPFRIRQLYGPEHGTVQITCAQYESTIVSQPEAVLSYLDEDDGEVITVGSSLELEQRLDEPAQESLGSEDCLHIFDIQHSTASLATWREHEAYTSKQFRCKPTSPPAAETTTTKPVKDLGMWTTDENGRPVYDRYVPRDPEEDSDNDELWSLQSQCGAMTIREDGPRSPVLGLSAASVTSPLVRENKSSPDRAQNPALAADSVSETVKPSTLVPTAEEKAKPISVPNLTPQASSTSSSSTIQQSVTLEQILGDTVKGLDNHLGGVAEFFDSTAKSLRTAAEKTRSTNSNAIEDLLGGFSEIFTEVGKLGQALIESIETETSALIKELKPLLERSKNQKATDTPPILQTASAQGPSNNAQSEGEAKRNDNRPSPAEIMCRTTRQSTVCQDKDDPEPFFGSEPKNNVKEPLILSVIRDTPLPSLPTLQPARNSSVAPPAPSKSQSLEKPKPVFPTYPVPPPMPTPQAKFAPFSWETLHKDEPKSRQEDDEEMRHIFSQYRGKSMKQVTTEIESNKSAGMPSYLLDRAFAMVWLQENCRRSHNSVPSEDVFSKYSERCRNDGVSAVSQGIFDKIVRIVFSSIEPRYLRVQGGSKHHYVDLSLCPDENEPHLSSKSILDLETSDPDFSIRYPPLMSLRRARTVAGLHDTSKEAKASNLTTQAALFRYPSIDQLERGKPSIRHEPAPPIVKRTTNPTVEDASDDDDHERDHRSSKRLALESLLNGYTTKSSEDVETANATLATAQPASTRPLPGAWPENINDGQSPSSPVNPAHHFQSFDRQPPTGFRYVEWPRANERRSYPSNDSSLHRTQTVAATNPAARLTRPFDPLAWNSTGPRYVPLPFKHSEPSLSHEPVELPRRSSTERYTSRPRRSFGPPSRVSFDPFPPEAKEAPTSKAQRKLPSPPPPPPARSHYTRTRSLRHMRSEPQFNRLAEPTGQPRSPWSSVDECVRQLRNMGYGGGDVHESARLSIYASASKGDVVAAMDMIEEDRRAAGEVWRYSPSKNDAMDGLVEED